MNQSISPDLTVKQVADIVQVTEETVRRYIRRDLLRTYRLLNGEHRITQEALNQFRKGLSQCPS